MRNRILNTILIIGSELNSEALIENASYLEQRALINHIFQTTNGKNTGDIILRLVVIDSLYSTNAGYSYFSFDEMAKKISSLGDDRAVCDYLYALIHGQKDKENVFSEPYGYQKHLGEGNRQMSLLSKYAYYCLQQNKEEYPLGFPIYDKLALESYPRVCSLVGLKNSLPSGDISIEKYIKALEEVRKTLFNGNELVLGLQQFDLLDAYLWRMGKFSSGNMSLLLTRDDYAKFIKNLGVQLKKNEKDGDYKARICNKYKVPNNSEFLGKAIVILLRRETISPFKGLSNEKYMNELLAHWRLFDSIKPVRKNNSNKH